MAKEDDPFLFLGFLAYFQGQRVNSFLLGVFVCEPCFMSCVSISSTPRSQRPHNLLGGGRSRDAKRDGHEMPERFFFHQTVRGRCGRSEFGKGLMKICIGLQEKLGVSKYRGTPKMDGLQYGTPN